MKKKRFAIFGNVYQEKKSMAVQKMFNVLLAHDAELAVERGFHNFLTDGHKIDVPPCSIFERSDFEADIVISMGGDGTFLNVASRVGSKQIPILGVNTGRLGFLSCITAEDIEPMIAEIYDADYLVADHSVLQVTCDEVQLTGYPFALNEVSILKHDSSSMISINTCINNEYLTTYQADGLLVSTPTGSTAYSLSVGGPVIYPQSANILLTPVAPHSLNMRPLVLNDNVEVEMRVESRSHSFLISIDGRSQSCREGVHIKVRKAPFAVKVISRKGQSFFSTIRHKMMWGADNRN